MYVGTLGAVPQYYGISCVTWDAHCHWSVNQGFWSDLGCLGLFLAVKVSLSVHSKRSKF